MLLGEDRRLFCPSLSPTVSGITHVSFNNQLKQFSCCLSFKFDIALKDINILLYKLHTIHAQGHNQMIVTQAPHHTMSPHLTLFTIHQHLPLRKSQHFWHYLYELYICNTNNMIYHWYILDLSEKKVLIIGIPYLRLEAQNKYNKLPLYTMAVVSDII